MQPNNAMTAAKARTLAGVPDDEYAREMAASVDRLIEEAARNKKREIHVREEFWAHGGYNQSPTWLAACDLLRERGFRVEFFYEERQFVDMGTVIRW